MIDWLLSTALAIPVAQLLPVPLRPSSDNCVQKIYPGKFGVAKNDTSGVRRTFPCPETVTVCHEGLGKPETQAELSLVCAAQLLGHPPVEEIPMSFCADSASVMGTQPVTAVDPPCVQKVLVGFCTQN